MSGSFNSGNLVLSPRCFGETPDKYRREIAAKAFYVLKQYYLIDRHPITSFEFSKEDLQFQKEVGGTLEIPVVIVGLTQDDFVYLPKNNSLKIFSDFADCLIPIFTSLNKAVNFFTVLQNSGCQFPGMKLFSIAYDQHPKILLSQKKAIINPIPEFLLTTVVCFGRTALKQYDYSENGEWIISTLTL
ncbi:MAG: hypothetical protein ABFC97_01340 [Anaerolineaceae bacterium]